MLRRVRVIVGGMSLAVFAAWPAAGDDSAAKRPSPPALDAQLLDDLDSALLEGLEEDLGDFAPPAASSQQQPPQPAAPPSPDPARVEEKRPADSVVEGEDIGGPDVAGDDVSPLTQIEQKMRQVEQRLAQRDPSSATQTLQRQIAEELALLLEQLRQQQQQQNQSNQNSRQQQQSASSSNSQNQQPSAESNPSNQPAERPAADSEERLGKVEEDRIRPEDLRELFQRAWGHLPPQVREQMQSAAEEQFLPKYETLIEDYYKRLAEEGRP